MYYYQVHITPNLLWVIPIFVIQSFFTYGLSLILAALNLLYRDIQYLLGLITNLWLYMTPVMYPMEIVPDSYRWVFRLNPMAVLINAYREAVLGGNHPKYSSLIIAALVALITYLVGKSIFRKLEGIFADVA